MVYDFITSVLPKSPELNESILHSINPMTPAVSSGETYK